MRLCLLATGEVADGSDAIPDSRMFLRIDQSAMNAEKRRLLVSIQVEKVSV